MKLVPSNYLQQDFDFEVLYIDLTFTHCKQSPNFKAVFSKSHILPFEKGYLFFSFAVAQKLGLGTFSPALFSSLRHSLSKTRRMVQIIVYIIISSF